MKIKTSICAVALLAVSMAGTAAAEVRNVVSYRTTIQRISEYAQIVVVGKLDRVENVQLAEVGPDAAQWPRRHEGKTQDGENNVRRDGILTVQQVLKGEAGNELRFVSIRQLKFENYDEDLRTENAVWFLAKRPGDDRLIVLAEERGAITGSDVNGNFTNAVDFVRDHLAGNAGIDRMLDAIDLKGGRLSIDCALDLSWYPEHYTEAMTETQKQRIVSLANLSPVGSRERNELITCIGRYKPEGGHNALMTLVLNDHNWSTTSLGCWALEEIDRGAAIRALIAEWPNAKDDKGRQTAIVRALGLIRPKAEGALGWAPGHDTTEQRTQTLEIVGGLLNSGTDKTLLREALIASRDLRTEQEHIPALKKLIDERETNGLGDAEIKAAIIALAAARKIVKIETGYAQAIYAREYLNELAEADPILGQVIKPALLTPWTMLITGADGRGH